MSQLRISDMDTRKDELSLVLLKATALVVVIPVQMCIRDRCNTGENLGFLKIESHILRIADDSINRDHLCSYVEEDGKYSHDKIRI